MTFTASMSQRAVHIGGALVAGAALLGLAAVASAHPGLVASGIIHSCVSNPSPGGPNIGSPGTQPGGAIRIVGATTTCNATETAMDWNAQGPKGDKGDQGIQGLQGNTGTTGPQGLPGVSGYEQVKTTFSVLAKNVAIGYAKCPVGKKVVGGGHIVRATNGYTAGDLDIFDSMPADATQNEDSWIVQAFNRSAKPLMIEIRAVCVTTL